MLSDLEILQNAERSLMDETEPFDFAEWSSCTCGHIYHGATGDYTGSVARIWGHDEDVYDAVMRKVTEALGLRVENEEYAIAISEYTMMVSGIKDDLDEWNTSDYYRVTREHSLKVIREAIEKIPEMDLIKIRDAHNYEVVNVPEAR